MTMQSKFMQAGVTNLELDCTCKTDTLFFLSFIEWTVSVYILKSVLFLSKLFGDLFSLLSQIIIFAFVDGFCFRLCFGVATIKAFMASISNTAFLNIKKIAGVTVHSLLRNNAKRFRNLEKLNFIACSNRLKRSFYHLTTMGAKKRV